MTLRLTHCLPLLAVLLCAGPVASAQEVPTAPPISAPPPPPEIGDAPPAPTSPPAASEGRAPDLAHRHSVMEVRASLLTGFPDLIGLSASVTALRPLEIEAGVSTAFLISGAYVRVGGAFELADGRDTWGRGWTSHLLVMGGYRYISVVNILGSGANESHNVTGNAGLDAVLWVNPHLGLNLRLELGVAYAISNHNVSQWFPDVCFSVGAAF